MKRGGLAARLSQLEDNGAGECHLCHGRAPHGGCASYSRPAASTATTRAARCRTAPTSGPARDAAGPTAGRA